MLPYVRDDLGHSLGLVVDAGEAAVDLTVDGVGEWLSDGGAHIREHIAA